MAESRRETAGPAARGAAGWALPVALIAALLTLAAVALRLGPPAPLPAGAPADQFAAGRARAVLAELAGGGQAHPVGSPAAAAVRERILANLRASGYQPKVEEGFACSRGGACATVENVVAELPGREPGSAVLLAAHYDSVAGGPGIADDLAGVAAILETARILKAGPPLRHSILFLLDEGEEAGLLGAEAFFAGSPEAPRVRAAVNLEARGSSGRSLMFETSPDNAWLVRLFAASSRRPATSSVFATIYELLPNDTDFTVVKRRGVSGLNFAFIGDWEHYHTAHDDLADLSLGSLQHHGDNALGTVRALAGADIARPHRGRAVFFDLLGWKVIWWPSAWNLGLAIAGLALLVLAAVRLRGRGLLPGRSLALGLAAWPLAVLATGLVGFVLFFLLQLVGAFRVPWPARPFPGEATFWFLGATVALATLGWVRRAGFAGLWVGCWLWWGLCGLLLTFVLPGASYLFVAPVLVAGLAALALPASEGGRAFATALPAVAAGLVWFPIVIPLYEGMGVSLLPVIGLLVALVLTSLLPLVAEAAGAWRFGLPALAGFLAVVMAVGVVVVPQFSPQSPRRLNLSYVEDADAHQGRWVVPSLAPLPPPLAKAAAFGRRPAPPFPWSPLPAYTAAAPALGLAAPELTVLEDVDVGGKRNLRLRLRSPRGAAVGIVVIPAAAGVESLAVAGHEVPSLPRGQGGGWRTLAVLTLPPQGIEIEAVTKAAAPQQWTVLDRTPGLPPAGAALLQARPDTAVPGQDGDVTTVSRKVAI